MSAIANRIGRPLGATGLSLLSGMTVGDSVFLPGFSSYNQTTKYAARYGGKFFTRKANEGGVYGVRIWRIE